MKIKARVNLLRWTFLGLILMPFAAVIAGCAVEESDINSGFFVDAPVEGLMFESGSLIGRTDAEGRFYYETGQDVTFSIEDVVIATIEPKDFVAPFDLVSSTAFVSDTETTNISRLIQSLDIEDGPDNGITISETTRADFQVFTSLSPLDFTTSGFAAISSLFAGAIGDLRSPVAAQTHLLASLAQYGKLSIDLINLGDGFTAGMQSSKTAFQNVTVTTADVNLHQSTQSNGYATLLAGQIRNAIGNNLTWVNQQLKMDVFRNKSSILGEIIPYNLAVPGATTKSFINYSAGNGNKIADLLLLPIFANISASPPSGTQLDAAKLLASQSGHEQRLKVFTLWIGVNDVLGAITANEGSELTTSDINTFLSDVGAGHDATSVMSNISSAVYELSSVKDSYVFIATLPDVTKIGSLYYREDMETLATFDGYSVTSMEYFDNVTGTEIVALGSNAFAHYSSDSSVTGVSGYLNYSSDNDLNTAINGLNDNLTLTKDEADLIKTRVDEINTYIKTFADPFDYPNVFVVDIYGLFEELNSGAVLVETDTLERRFGGGFFSMDGVYPSNTGYGLIAKEFIERIGSPFILATSDASYSNYSSYVSQTGLNPDNGIGINIDPEALDLAGIWSNDPYRDIDGDGFPAGPGDVILSDYNTISSIDPSLDFMQDCSDTYISLLPEAISGTDCDDL